MLKYCIVYTIKYNPFDFTIFRAISVWFCGFLYSLLYILLLCWSVVHLMNVHYTYLYIYCYMFRPTITAVIKQFHNNIKGSLLR